MKFKNRNIRKAINVTRVTAMLFFVMLLFSISSGELNSYFYKGHIFKHPFFENKCLHSAQNAVFIEASESFLLFSPKAISYSGTDKKVFGAYLSGDSLYVFSTSPLPDNCVYLLNFTEPHLISTGSVVVDSNTVIYSVKENSSGVFRLCVSGRDGRVHIYSIDATSFSVLSSDSVILKNATGSVITSISGISSSYSSVDSVLWITGSNGLLRSVHIGSKEETVFDIAATETVECFGDGLAGTRSGSVYEYKNSAFQKVLTVSGAIRSINSKALAGNGVIYVKSSSGWTKVREGTAERYRECIVSANSTGSLFEYTDEKWGIGSIIGPDSPTQITSVLPATLSSYINSSSKFKFRNPMSTIEITVKLQDNEKNYKPLSIICKTRNESIEIGLESGAAKLGNRDPSGSCQIGTISFADSSITVLVTPDWVTVTADALVGREDLFCKECALKPYTFKNDQMWALGDELVISSATQTLTIVNERGAVMTFSGTRKREEKRISVVSGTFLASIGIPAGTQIVDVRAYDLSGQMITSDLTGGVIRLGQTGSSVVTLQVRLFGGKVLTLRSVLTRN